MSSVASSSGNRCTYTVNVVRTSRWPISSEMSIGLIPAATQRLAYVWRSEWKDCVGDSFAVSASAVRPPGAGQG